ncbi:LPS-assembly protein LptD [Halomonas sp. YLGW01]|uniref:LPS-assembly protein LptD n=1 Tax=Halomonas sp. YLGW01 TaxID=2773308 RepID=UPI001785549A|nr:LPS-assembly protein LptD [Halomonas sp. YLGW01]
MGKRHYWSALAGLATVAGNHALAAPPASLPAAQLDWQPWGDEAPADALCRGHYVMPDYRLPAGENPEAIRSSSDSARYDEDGTVRLAGEVLLRRGNSQVEAPEVLLGPARERAQVSGPLALRDRGLLVRGASAEVALNSDAASVDSAHYVTHDARLRGDAQRLARLEDGRYQLSDASFTTCEPGNALWRLVGSDIVLDRESGFGTAKHARLEVQEVPVFYWPWVRFPIDDRRQTGFLWPAISVSGNGLDYSQPFYWNIAPNQDATITPRWVSDSGLLLGGEYRYLQRDFSGTLEGAYLSRDRNAGDDDGSTALEDGDTRWYMDYHHQGQLSSRLGYELAYGAASDGAYFDDFGRDFGESETDKLSRLARLGYGGETWQLEASAQGYQKLEDPLDDDDKPFYRLPSLTANARWDQDNGVYQQWRSNATYFWRDVDETDSDIDDDEAANGSRVHLAPALGWRADPSWGFLEPKVTLDSTHYELDYGNRDTDNATTLSRSVPVSSIDGGLVFERELSAFGGDYRQTLEPRLNYAYVPAEDQQEYPDFDTSEKAFSWGQLWSPYRFSGADRVGDLNRLSGGVSSRFLADDSGRERLDLGIGMGVYFEDRTIDMDGDPNDVPDRDSDYDAWYRATRDRTPLVTKAEWQINEAWSAGSTWLYDTERDLTERSGVDLAYRHPDGHVLNLGYGWELQGYDPSADDEEDQVGYDQEEFDVSFALSTGARFDLIGRYLYDNTNSRSLERLAGVQWNDCCYGLQLVWRDWVEDNDTADSIDDDYTDRGIFLRFIFKGLGGVGQEADTYFEQAIPGYRSTDF